MDQGYSYYQCEDEAFQMKAEEQVRFQDQGQFIEDRMQEDVEPDFVETPQQDQFYGYHTSFIEQQPEPLQQQSRQVRTMTLRVATEIKNLSKTIGNHFSKYIKKHKLNDANQVLKKFADKKVKGQQSKYIINDFVELHKNPQAKQVLQFYLFDQAYIDILNSKQMDNKKVIDFIDFIERQYASSEVQGGITSNLHGFHNPEDQSPQEQGH